MKKVISKRRVTTHAPGQPNQQQQPQHHPPPIQPPERRKKGPADVNSVMEHFLSRKRGVGEWRGCREVKAVVERRVHARPKDVRKFPKCLGHAPRGTFVDLS